MVKMDIMDEDSIQVRPRLHNPLKKWMPLPSCQWACIRYSLSKTCLHCGCQKASLQKLDSNIVQEAFKSVSERHDQLDRLINAAGVLHTEEMSPGMHLISRL